jgi:hypothetical protein
MANTDDTLGSWVPEEDELWFSDRFNVDPVVLEDYGAYDISVVTDTPLFIDPFLLFTSEDDKYQALHEGMLEYLRFLKRKGSAPLTEGAIQNWYAFREVKQNWLGFTEDSNAGHGLGKKFARELHQAFGGLLKNFGEETVTESSHLEKLALVSDGVGRDTVSDFTANLIKHFLCKYTQDFARKHIDGHLLDTFSVARAAFDYNTESWATRRYELPRLGKDFVLLTPMDLLTKDDTWINRSDMLTKFDLLPDALPDVQVRAQVNNYFRRVLVRNPTAKQLREARASTIKAFPELADYYIAIKEEHGDEARETSLDKAKETQALLRDQVKLAARDIADKTTLYDNPWTSYDEAREAVDTFQRYVEHQDGYRVINRGGGKVGFAKESEVQGFFGLLLQGSWFDVNREPNNGRGPVDFKISMGAVDKTLIEFKLAKSSSLKRNVENQLAIYEKANKTNTSVLVIIGYTGAEMAKAQKVVHDVGRMPSKLAKSIVIVDARADNKPSASTV